VPLSSFFCVYSGAEQLNGKLTESSVLVACGLFGLMLVVTDTVGPVVSPSEGSRDLRYLVLSVGKQFWS